jgi:hypothetical protein
MPYYSTSTCTTSSSNTLSSSGSSNRHPYTRYEYESAKNWYITNPTKQTCSPCDPSRKACKRYACAVGLNWDI